MIKEILLTAALAQNLVFAGELPAEKSMVEPIKAESEAYSLDLDFEIPEIDLSELNSFNFDVDPIEQEEETKEFEDPNIDESEYPEEKDGKYRNEFIGYDDNTYVAYITEDEYEKIMSLSDADFMEWLRNNAEVVR